MAKRIITKIGDVFSVIIDREYKAYLQFICIDHTNLNSDTIRVFKTKYPVDFDPRIEEIVKDKVLFYSHTIIKFGVLHGGWTKVGKSSELGMDGLEKIWFGQALDTIYDKGKSIKIDPLKNWTIFKINGKRINCGVLPVNLYSLVEGSCIYNYMTINQRIKYGYFFNSDPIYDVIKRVPREDVSSFLRIVNHGEEVFYHFIGADLVRMISKESSGRFVKRVSLDSKEIKFWEINWRYRDFISENSFNNLWNSLID